MAKDNARVMLVFFVAAVACGIIAGQLLDSLGNHQVVEKAVLHTACQKIFNNAETQTASSWYDSTIPGPGMTEKELYCRVYNYTFPNDKLDFCRSEMMICQVKPKNSCCNVVKVELPLPINPDWRDEHG